MTDSSLTKPLPHLKVYKHHMGGLAVSGSHGLRETSEYIVPRETLISGPHAGTRLYIKQPPQVVRWATDTYRSWSR